MTPIVATELNSRPLSALKYFMTTGRLILAIGASAAVLSGEGTPWERYLEFPTSDNAEKVTAISYSHGLPTGQTAGDLRVLETQVQAADRQAGRLAFRLLRKADGHIAELLCVMLGRLIRSEPALFLAEAGAANLEPSLLGQVVAAVGPEYVDRPRARRYEIECRIAALESVRDARVKEQREACVKVLQDELVHLED